jgi:hypothetical protein
MIQGMDPRFAIMGLPGSGKTTFLAALWHLIEAGEKDCRLKLEKLKGNLVYLNKIAEAWRKFQPVERTSHTGDTDVTMSLIDTVTGAKGTAFFPDIAGERFSEQVEGRRSRRTFVDDVERCDGILLFIDANAPQDYLSVLDLDDQITPDEEVAYRREMGPEVGGATSVSGEGADQQEEAAPVKGREWEPKYLPAQVRIVQMLSDLLRPPFEARRRRLGIILSAWDMRISSGMTPSELIAGNMPLLDQFLKSNEDSFHVHIYGVSAQGLSLKDQAAIAQASKGNPSQRILIVDGAAHGHDITKPLVWLMAND